MTPTATELRGHSPIEGEGERGTTVRAVECRCITETGSGVFPRPVGFWYAVRILLRISPVQSCPNPPTPTNWFNSLSDVG
jgi:hypothetical protein